MFSKKFPELAFDRMQSLFTCTNRLFDFATPEYEFEVGGRSVDRSVDRCSFNAPPWLHTIWRKRPLKRQKLKDKELRCNRAIVSIISLVRSDYCNELSNFKPLFCIDMA